ncbi:subtilisin-like serine protease [Diplodia corticola]|uniref:Subtilisin-like serine protease n=1 Tax=Diplodia corticola TaxID=236234 RepID=A0A1J9QQR8_9PEZI|nr:subtilisin-like serine protease [Diplodia corticola]OJD30792.1 subtilisin-like serine protease [Diplodia corticola]
MPHPQSAASSASSTLVSGVHFRGGLADFSRRGPGFFPPFSVNVLPDPTPDLPSHQASPRSPDENDSLLLPATWRNAQDDIETPRGRCQHFLTKDLCVARLNAIHKSMWVVGRPMPPRPLTAQLVHRREIVITEDINLHLVWAKGCMFLKPLPRYLVVPSFWERHLCPPPAEPPVTTCPTHRDTSAHKHDAASVAELASCAAGFLFTWTALIAHESDWKIAHDKGLIPNDLSWYGWKALTEDFLDPSRRPASKIYRAINERFHYGELRLGRLNKIYRLQKLHVRGYLFGYTMKSDFFAENFTRLASVLGYIVIVLTAMQVGLGTERLQASPMFQAASYGFTVFSIIAPLIAVALVLAVFLYLVLWNVKETRKYERNRFKDMGLKDGSSKKTRTNLSMA